MNQRGSDTNRSLIYFFMYCPLGAICPLIGQYLSSIGFSGTQVGIITSLGTGTAIGAGLLWAKVYSNTDKKRNVIMYMCAACAALGLLSTTTMVFAIYALIYSGMYFFQGPVFGLSDDFMISKSNNFAIIRGIGAAGYAVSAFLVGRFAEANGLKSIFYIYAITFMVAVALLLRESDPPVYKEKTEKIGIGQLFKDKVFVKLLICSFFLTGTGVAHNTYFGYLFREEGGTIAGIGLAFLLMAGSEAPMMALVPKLSKKIGAERLILFAAIITVIRFAFYATGPSYKLLLGTFFLQGMTQGIVLVEIVKYFSKIVDRRMSGMAISIYYALGNNFSVIACSLLGGIVLDWAGARAVYMIFTVFNIIAVILYIVFGMYKTDETRRQC